MAGPSSPYYRFGYQGGRYPFAWSGGAGGVPNSGRAADTRGLGLVQLDESGLTPYSMQWPPLANRSRYHSTSDWPALRPAGPEPLTLKGLGLSPGELFAGAGILQLLIYAGIGYLGYRLFFAKKKRNPARRRRRRNPSRQLPVPPGVRVPAYYKKK